MTPVRDATCPAELPESVKPLLADLVSGLRRVLPEITGAWVYGSIALGAFDERTSDIDLVVVSSERLTDDRIDQLVILHGDLPRRHVLAPRLEAQYLTLDELREAVPTIGYPVYHEGRFERAGRGDLNATTRWVLRQHGITLLGPPAAELPLDVSWDDVRAAMRYNLTGYWPGYATDQALPTLLADVLVVWTVATLCRILSAVADDEIVSKPAAVVEWLARVPDRWSRLLREVQRIQGTVDLPPGYASPLDRAGDVQGFVVWAREYGLALLNGRPARPVLP